MLPQKVIINTPQTYYRFHGISKLFYSEYSENDIEAVAREMIKNKNIEQGYFYFNNTATIAAINNADQLKKYLDKKIK